MKKLIIALVLVFSTYMLASYYVNEVPISVSKTRYFPLVTVSPGGSGTVITAVGDYVGEAFGIGDDIYVVFEVFDDWDETSDFTIGMHYCHNTAGESAEEMQFTADWSACPHDGTESLAAPTHADAIDGGDFSPHATQYQNDEQTLGTISAASLVVGDDMGITLTRIAIDAGDEVEGEPIVIHLTVTYDADRRGQ